MRAENSTIPVIDIFAGPGGLGEGFCGLLNDGKRFFDIVLSIEKEFYAHKTLTLRSFFRQFEPGEAPEEYYRLVKGEITEEDLYAAYPVEAEFAKREAWHAELGEGNKAVPNHLVDERIKEALGGAKDWLLIGGPPCQAYSVVGRSRRKEMVLDEQKDERVGLYKQYLRILAVHNPSVFVMENVKGLLSAKTEQSPVFSRILNDLSDPVKAYQLDYQQGNDDLACPGYHIYSLVKKPDSFEFDGKPVYSHNDFVIESEDYGIPQTRHRVILLGIRKDIGLEPDTLNKVDQVPVAKVLTGLPALRSGLSRGIDDCYRWMETLGGMAIQGYIEDVDKHVSDEIIRQINNLRAPKEDIGGEYVLSDKVQCEYESDWFCDERLGGVLNHASRSHMESDLYRYLFVSVYGKVNGVSPKLKDFPVKLLPAHESVNDGAGSKKFADRFRVQLWGEPCKTITSHISKDGHYYIHPDSAQCRSFTVREAARIQTFPDNYFFCGPRTAQYQQVGNAVPPYLAYQIGKIVSQIFYNKDKINRLKPAVEGTLLANL